MKFREALDRNPWVLSHHPVCERFADHTRTVRGRKVCKGCLATYPSGAVALVVVAVLLWLADPVPRGWVPWQFFLAAALAAELVDMTRLLVSLPRPFDMVPRICRGISLALMLAAMAVADDVTVVVVLLVLLTLGYAVSGYTAWRAFRVCDTCPEQGRFPECSGLQGFMPRGRGR